MTTCAHAQTRLLSLLFLTVMVMAIEVATTTTEKNGNITQSSTKSNSSPLQVSTGESTTEGPPPTTDVPIKNKTLVILLNSNVSFSCINNASVANVWWFNGKIIFAEGKGYLTEEFPNVNFTSDQNVSEIHIKEIQPYNAGNYICKQADYKEYYFVSVKMPITELFVKLCINEAWESPPFDEIESDSYEVLCYGNYQPTQEFDWEITNHTIYNNTVNEKATECNNSINVTGSVLKIYITRPGAEITCRHGNLNKTIHLKVVDATVGLEEFLSFMFIVAGIIVFIVLAVTVAVYVISNYAFSSKERESHLSSIYSMPSMTSLSNVPASAPSPPERCDDKDSEISVPPREPLNDMNSFERDMDTFGIRLQSFRSRDTFNEFWEATLCGGDFKDQIIVRSLSGNATMDLLEEFRKFQVGIGDLPQNTNIWNVLGCSKDKLPYRICYEFHVQTTVREFLLGNFQTSDGSDDQRRQTRNLMSLATDIANGMEFLKSYAFDHVALRTEKILIDRTSRGKLYDFCLSSQSQKIAVGFLSEQSEVIAWLAPELIFLEEYNQWTDIWAFGVVMWELWCGGRTPHCGKSRENLEADLRNQRFLVQPNNCPGAVYSLMLSCWKNNASERRMFNDIHSELNHLKESADNEWSGNYEYSSLPGSTFYTVLDNDYDQYAAPST